MKTRLDDLVELSLGAGETMDLRTVGDVFVDRLRERVRLLENHADAGAQFDDVDARVVDITFVEGDLAGDAAAVDGVVHAVECAQERRLATAGRADQRGDGVFTDVEVHIEKRTLFAIIYRNVLSDHLEGNSVHFLVQRLFNCCF